MAGMKTRQPVWNGLHYMEGKNEKRVFEHTLRYLIHNYQIQSSDLRHNFK